MHTIVWMNIGVAVGTIYMFLMYTFALELNTRTKIRAEAWMDEGVQEVAYEWTKGLRQFFGFRLLATFVICYGGDVHTNRIFLYATALYNLYFVVAFVRGLPCAGGKVVKMAHTVLPTIIVSTHFLGALFCVVYDLFLA